ncbi:hypothetical protein SASPL_149816 [Salvia splendens]|uniref:Late embryogenesis abundant protein LEA-2 subgroup domain-containing protein n=1 Tax=Salvia splendens TaxID=180675 RepID=A0A8X8Z1G2_SALSN|nr:hypothetical protein SASPL_149816 [Salvia splendens]
MTPAKSSGTTAIGQPLLPQPPQYVIVAPPYPIPYRSHHRRRRDSCSSCRLICIASTLFVLAAAVYLLWPSDPELSVVRLNLDRLHFRTSPALSLDITLDLTVKVRNRDFYSLDYDSLRVAIGYRGERLGSVKSAGGHINARGSSYVNATLRLDAVEVLTSAIFLLEDLVRGSITFDTDTEISGELGLFFVDLPLKIRQKYHVKSSLTQAIIQLLTKIATQR